MFILALLVPLPCLLAKGPFWCTLGCAAQNPCMKWLVAWTVDCLLAQGYTFLEQHIANDLLLQGCKCQAISAECRKYWRASLVPELSHGVSHGHIQIAWQLNCSLCLYFFHFHCGPQMSIMRAHSNKYPAPYTPIQSLLPCSSNLWLHIWVNYFSLKSQ